MRKTLFCFALILAIGLPMGAWAQKSRSQKLQRRPAKAARRLAQPVRTLAGQMLGSNISVLAGGDRAAFGYMLRGARIVDGRLQFQGTITPGPSGERKSYDTTAVLVGTLARSANPWPSASQQQPTRQPQGREARSPETAGQLGQLAQSTQSTARTTQTPTSPQGRRPAEGEVTEQTQSLYAAIDIGTGCEIMYLKLELPPPLATALSASRPVQLGVVLAPIDNRAGEQINRRVCHIVRALDSGRESKAELAELNRLLGNER